MGESKALGPFVKACDQFKYLDLILDHGETDDTAPAAPAAEAAATPYIMASVAPWASMFTEKGTSSLKANMQPLSAVYNMRVNSSPSAVSTPFSMP